MWWHRCFKSKRFVWLYSLVLNETTSNEEIQSIRKMDIIGLISEKFLKECYSKIGMFREITL